MKYKDPTTGNFKEINVKVADTLPVGSEVDYNGTTIPTGWEEVDSPNDYSTEETKIGTWIDGKDRKPLYRKIISSTSPNVTKENENITKKIPVNVDIKFGCIEKAFYKDDSGNIVNIPFIMTGGQVIKAYLNVQDNNIVLTSNTQYTNDKPVSIVINYTKTTD